MSDIIPISEDEQEQYSYISNRIKANVMADYLLGVDGKLLNMEAIGGRYFPEKKQPSRIVSLIHRANGINCEADGKAGWHRSKAGLYRENCDFEKMYHYRVTRKDFADFVKEFEPYGSISSGVTFEDWLIERARERNKQLTSKPERYGQDVGLESQNAFEMPKEENDSDSDSTLKLLFIIVAVSLIVLFANGSKVISFAKNLGSWIMVGIIAVIFWKLFLKKKKSTPKEKPSAQKVHTANNRTVPASPAVKGNAPREKIDPGRMLWAVILCVIGVGGVLNGGNLLLGAFFCLLGLGALKRK